MSDSWKSPTTIIALVTLLLSICGNIFQYYNFKLDKEKWEIEKENIVQQKNDLQKRLDVFLKEKEVEEKRVSELKDEIDQLTVDIDKLSKEITSALFIAQMATSRMLSSESTEQEQADALNRSEAAIARSKELEAMKERLINKKKEKEAEYNKIVFQ